MLGWPTNKSNTDYLATSQIDSYACLFDNEWTVFVLIMLRAGPKISLKNEEKIIKNILAVLLNN